MTRYGLKTATLASAADAPRDPVKVAIRVRTRFPQNSPPPQSYLKGVEPDRLLQEGELLAGRFRVRATPGHDDDCLMWIDTRTNTAFTGDSLQANGTPTQGIGFYRSLPAYRATLATLAAARLVMVVFMVFACLLAPLLTSAKTAFDLMLLIGAGSGPIFLLRWFWMRINAWSEIVGILAALLAAVFLELVLPRCGAPALASWQKILVGAGVTTVSWLVATFVTKPEPQAVQDRFRALVRADGRDAGKGVLWTFLVSVAIFASMGLVAAFVRGF